MKHRVTNSWTRNFCCYQHNQLHPWHPLIFPIPRKRSLSAPVEITVFKMYYQRLAPSIHSILNFYRISFILHLILVFSPFLFFLLSMSSSSSDWIRNRKSLKPANSLLQRKTINGETITASKNHYENVKTAKLEAESEGIKSTGTTKTSPQTPLPSTQNLSSKFTALQKKPSLSLVHKVNKSRTHFMSIALTACVVDAVCTKNSFM